MTLGEEVIMRTKIDESKREAKMQRDREIAVEQERKHQEEGKKDKNRPILRQ